jgi:hypothetical protein
MTGKVVPIKVVTAHRTPLLGVGWRNSGSREATGGDGASMHVSLFRCSWSTQEGSETTGRGGLGGCREVNSKDSSEGCESCEESESAHVGDLGCLKLVKNCVKKNECGVVRNVNCVCRETSERS